uniref:Uncharacterized protein n=1 Tax=Oryza brachyantha TaxID=4533 RepID=J3NCT5_ORYBR
MACQGFLAYESCAQVCYAYYHVVGRMPSADGFFQSKCFLLKASHSRYHHVGATNSDIFINKISLGYFSNWIFLMLLTWSHGTFLSCY